MGHLADYWRKRREDVERPCLEDSGLILQGVKGLRVLGFKGGLGFWGSRHLCLGLKAHILNRDEP